MRWGLLLAVLVLFLTACSPAAEVETVEEQVEEAVEEVVEEPEVDEEQEFVPVLDVPEPVEEEGIYERPPEEKPSIARFLKHYKEDVKNYKFKFRNDKWSVKGDQARIELFRIIQNKYHAPFIDTIYLDLKRQTAVGVCEGLDDNIRRQCVVQEVLGKNFALPYTQFKIKLPHDWLVEFQNLYTTVSESPQLVLDRETVHLKHATRLRTTDLFIDPSSGLPVVVIDEGSEYNYQNLAKNQISSAEKMSP